VVVFVPLFGGFIAWASVKPRDPRAARSMLITGIIVTGMLFFGVVALIPAS
jgi:hypothetical protein